MKIQEYKDLRINNRNDVHRLFSTKMNNLNLLYETLLGYSLPFFDKEENDTLYIGNQSTCDILIWENNISLINLFEGALQLMDDANYLSIKMLQRGIFEFLIVNNHLLLTQDLKYIEDWFAERDIKIVKNILKRTNNEHASELIYFWVGLSRQSHASNWTTQSGLDMNETFAEYHSNIFTVYILLYLYNYQLRELYFPYMRTAFEKKGVEIHSPFSSDKFDTRDTIRELENKYNSDKLHKMVEAFQTKWSLK